MQIFPMSQYGRLRAIITKNWLITFEWPRGPMLWFFWNRGGSYRLGPITVDKLNITKG
jgi:hypothetical protein